MSTNWIPRLGYKNTPPPPTLSVLYHGRAVAEMKKERGKFLFRYLDAFFISGLSPLPGLPPKREFVSFVELPAFFKERLPDVRRPEIKQYIRENGINEKDELEMLGCLGAHSITDSYELRLRSVA